MCLVAAPAAAAGASAAGSAAAGSSAAMIAATVASLAISAATTAATLSAQAKQAQAMADYQGEVGTQQTKLINENNKNAVKALTDQWAQEGENTMAAQHATAQELQDIQRERLEKAAAATASSEAAGMNVEMLMADFERQEARYRDATLYNLEREQAQSQWRKTGYRSDAVSRINSQQPYIPTPVSRPNYVAGALSIASAGVNSYYKYKHPQE